MSNDRPIQRLNQTGSPVYILIDQWQASMTSFFIGTIKRFILYLNHVTVIRGANLPGDFVTPSVWLMVSGGRRHICCVAF